MTGWLIAGVAHAFCGTYVGPAGSTLENSESQIAVAVSGQALTLTMANDFSGSSADFALVIPVPEGFGEGDARVVSPGVLERVAEYSTPRVVSYSCRDFYPYEWGGELQDGPDRRHKGELSKSRPLGCTTYIAHANYKGAADTGFGTASASVGWGEVPGVEVEEQFLVGGYEMFVLSAEGADGLATWLGLNGFEIPASSQPVLDDYLASGAHFLAAKVDLDEVPAEVAYLPPIQLTWGSSGPVSLPIRLGALNSGGEQDLTLYVLSDIGEASVSTYPRVEPQRLCMLDGPDGDPGEAYEAILDEAFADVDAGWVLEYSFAAQKCDPCVGPGPLDATDTAALGFDAYGFSSGHFTRIRMRYAADAVDQDLALTFEPTGRNEQIRLVDYVEGLESEFRACGEDDFENPGSCVELDEDGTPRERGAACSVTSAVSLSPVMLALLVVGSRRF